MRSLDLVGLRPGCAERRWLTMRCLVVGAVIGGAGPSGLLHRPTAARAAPALHEAVQAAWQGVPLEAWIDEIAPLAGVPLIRDRRIDPGTSIEYEAGGEPLADVLAAVAAVAGGRIVVLGSTVRIVPVHGAGDVAAGERARLSEIATLSATARRNVTRREPWHWPAAARPRDLVAAAAAAAGVEIDGLELIPHDHLPAASLPPLERGERIDLLLGHYDLRAAWSSRGAAATGPVLRARILPLPYPQGGVSGPQAAEHRAVDRGEADRRSSARRDPRRPGRTGMPATDPRAEPRFTLRLEATLEQAVAALAGRFDLEPAIDREALSARGILPGEIVRVEVRDARREDLFDAVVAPLGLSWRIDDRRLVIEPRSVPEPTVSPP